MKEEIMDLPGEEDENVGDGIPKKKKEKKRKSREERIAERRVIFWTLVAVVVITLVFWLIPRIRTGNLSLPSFQFGKPDISLPKPEWKGYVEYKL